MGVREDGGVPCGIHLPGGYKCGRLNGHQGPCGEPWQPEPKEKWRANYVPAPHFFRLNHACRVINDALGGIGCYLVGSALTRRDYRDVDVRYIMDDAAYAKLFRDERGGWLNPLWSLLCTSISIWLQQETGLPIDFQIQNQSRANLWVRRHHGFTHRQSIRLAWGFTKMCLLLSPDTMARLRAEAP